jgi:hypothetical protein
MDAKALAASIPPVSKLGKAKAEPDEGYDAEGAADDDAAGVGMMEEFMSAVKGDDSAAAYEAFCRLMDSHRGV